MANLVLLSVAVFKRLIRKNFFFVKIYTKLFYDVTRGVNCDDNKRPEPEKQQFSVGSHA